VSPADLVFGGKPSGTGPQTVVLNVDIADVRSIWFEAGRDYTLQGTGFFILGGGLADNGRLVTVLEGGLPENRYTINLPIFLPAVNAQNPKKTYEIANYSTYSLLSFLGVISPQTNSLRVTGTGATYFGSGFLPAENTQIYTVAVADADPTIAPTIVLFKDAPSRLIVGDNTLAVDKRDFISLRGITVESGGTYAFRGNAAKYGVSGDDIAVTLSGHGLIRQEERSPLGAFYVDGWLEFAVGIINNPTDIALVTDTSFGARHGRSDGLVTGAVITGSGSAGFTKVGSGLVSLDGSVHTYESAYVRRKNEWSGATNLNGGVLRFSRKEPSWPFLGGYPLPNTTSLRFNGGILEGAIYPLQLGTSEGEVQWLGDGGFSAYMSSISVALNGGAGLTWDAGYFVPTGSKLLLSSRYAMSQNAIAQMSGALSGNGGGIEKNGPGLLWISNASNSYTGATLIHEGALRGSVPTNSLIQLEGGVLGLDGNFTRGVGTAGNQIRWLSSGGFAAYGANRTVKLGNLDTAITWGASNFVQAGCDSSAMVAPTSWRIAPA